MNGHKMGALAHYQTQDKEWIKQLPIQDLADKDSVLFMWAVSPLLPEAFDVISAWGFKYTTVAFCWVKETPLLGITVSNLGRWTMGGMEVCLLGKKGSPKRIKNNIKQMVFEIRGGHSKKPDEVKHRIVDLMGDLPRIELFARQKTEGWTSIGYDIDGMDIKESLDKLITQ